MLKCAQYKHLYSLTHITAALNNTSITPCDVFIDNNGVMWHLAAVL